MHMCLCCTFTPTQTASTRTQTAGTLTQAVIQTASIHTQAFTQTAGILFCNRRTPTQTAGALAQSAGTPTQTHTQLPDRRHPRCLRAQLVASTGAPPASADPLPARTRSTKKTARAAMQPSQPIEVVSRGHRLPKPYAPLLNRCARLELSGHDVQALQLVRQARANLRPAPELGR